MNKMFKSIFLVAISFALAASLKFEDCATDRCNRALTVHQLDLSPSPIHFPGELHVTFHLTVNQRISHLFLDTTLERHVLGLWLKIPCIGSTTFGSCQNTDLCTRLDRLVNGSPIMSQDLGLPFDAILLSALGHKAQCPIDPKCVFIDNEKITLQPLTGILKQMTGKFRLTMAVKDDPTILDNIGCIRFEFEIRPTHSDYPAVG